MTCAGLGEEGKKREGIVTNETRNTGFSELDE